MYLYFLDPITGKIIKKLEFALNYVIMEATAADDHLRTETEEY